MRSDHFSQLSMQGVSRRFGQREALSDFSLEIQGGEFVALLGPSGCGKSTALNCLAGLLPLTGGSIWMDGRRIDDLTPERRGFGMVFQNYALFPHLTVAGNIDFGLRMRKLPKAERRRRAAAALETVRLTDQAEKHPAQLSGGQQQRVAIARAIVLEPPLVLMDEPLSNLDAKLRLEMRTEVRRLHQSLELTTVYVTHDQEEALSLADRLVVVRDGRVQQVGTPEEVYTLPVNLFVAGFMGYRTLLELDLRQRAGDRAQLGDGAVAITGMAQGELPGRRAVAAIRPEDFTVIDGPSGDGNRLAVHVEVAEYHGRELSVEGRLASGEQIHFRTDRRLAPGDEVTVTVDSERVLVYAIEEAAATPATPTGGEPADAPPPAGSAEGGASRPAAMSSP
jgi:putative spermidine/putrescine transport system ATP-binding protein